jgi:hypothetical protein
MSESGELHLCTVCKVKWDRTHECQKDCIEDLRNALVQQSKVLVENKRSSTDQGSIIATRFLQIVEELCETDGQYQAIKEKYIAMCDWSPLTEAREELRKEQILNRRMEKLLIQVEAQAFRTGTMTTPEFASELKALLHPDDEKE